MTYQAGVVKIATLPDSDQVGNPGRHEHAGIAARGHARRNRLADGDQLVERHCPRPLVGVIRQPWHFKLASETADPFKHLGRAAGLRGAAEHPGSLAIARIVSLRSGNDRAVRHDARVAGIAAHRAQFDLPFPADYPARERNCAVLCDRMPVSS